MGQTENEILSFCRFTSRANAGGQRDRKMPTLYLAVREAVRTKEHEVVVSFIVPSPAVPRCYRGSSIWSLERTKSADSRYLVVCQSSIHQLASKQDSTRPCSIFFSATIVRVQQALSKISHESIQRTACIGLFRTRGERWNA